MRASSTKHDSNLIEDRTVRQAYDQVDPLVLHQVLDDIDSVHSNGILKLLIASHTPGTASEVSSGSSEW